MTRGSWIALVALVVAVLVVYGNALGLGFCYDENIVILRNDNVQDPDRIFALWSDTYWGTAVADSLDSRGWRPLTIFSFHLDHRAGGDDPWGYHLVNVLLHAACTALFLVLLVRLRLGLVVAVPAAALFALHAVHTEAVTQIVGRAELIAATGILAAALAHAHAFGPGPALRRPALRWPLVAAASLLFGLGLLGKESAVGFYGLVLATDVLAAGTGKGIAGTARGIFSSRWPAYAAYLVPLAGFLVARWALFGRAFPSHDVHFVDNPIVLLPVWLRPLGALLVFGKAVLVMLVPASLSADYGYAQLAVDRFWSSGLFWLGALALAGIVYLACRLRRDAPGATWGAIVLLAAWLPVSNALFSIQTIFGERVTYIPSIGLCVMVAALFALASRDRRTWLRTAAWTILGLVLVGNAVRTPVRNRDWRNDLTLFEATARVSTRSIRVLNNYGNVLYTRGDLAGAERQYRKALSLYADYDDARVNLAGVLIARGERAEARANLEAVLARNPGHPTALANLGLLDNVAPPP